MIKGKVIRRVNIKGFNDLKKLIFKTEKGFYIGYIGRNVCPMEGIPNPDCSSCGFFIYNICKSCKFYHEVNNSCSECFSGPGCRYPGRVEIKTRNGRIFIARSIEPRDLIDEEWLAYYIK